MDFGRIGDVDILWRCGVDGTGFRTERYLGAILMAWGYSAYRMRVSIAQKYHYGAMRYKCRLLYESASVTVRKIQLLRLRLRG